jgi:hypothetical protein
MRPTATIPPLIEDMALADRVQEERLPETWGGPVRNQQYVLGFAMNENDVLLIRKDKPLWQRGLLNGVGGKLQHYDASVRYAMEREFREETGQMVPALRWAHFHTERFAATGNVVYCLYAHVPRGVMHDACRWTHHQRREEQCEYRAWREIAGPYAVPGVMYNLPWMLAMARCHMQCAAVGRDDDNGAPYLPAGVCA